VNRRKSVSDALSFLRGRIRGVTEVGGGLLILPWLELLSRQPLRPGRVVGWLVCIHRSCRKLTNRPEKRAIDSRYAKTTQVMRESKQRRPRLRRLGDERARYCSRAELRLPGDARHQRSHNRLAQSI
jgi:hypothetical protein